MHSRYNICRVSRLFINAVNGDIFKCLMHPSKICIRIITILIVKTTASDLRKIKKKFPDSGCFQEMINHNPYNFLYSPLKMNGSDNGYI